MRRRRFEHGIQIHRVGTKHLDVAGFLSDTLQVAAIKTNPIWAFREARIYWADLMPDRHSQTAQEISDKKPLPWPSPASWTVPDRPADIRSFPLPIRSPTNRFFSEVSKTAVPYVPVRSSKKSCLEYTLPVSFKKQVTVYFVAIKLESFDRNHTVISQQYQACFSPNGCDAVPLADKAIVRNRNRCLPGETEKSPRYFASPTSSSEFSYPFCSAVSGLSGSIRYFLPVDQKLVLILARRQPDASPPNVCRRRRPRE